MSFQMDLRTHNTNNNPANCSTTFCVQKELHIPIDKPTKSCFTNDLVVFLSTKPLVLG